MNAPRRPDGPPVRGGLPYSAIAHLAEDVKSFVAMARALRERGLSAPQIHAADLNEGLVLLEDLGTEGVVEGDPPSPVEERYAAAVDVLVALHREPLPATLTVAPGVEYRVPPYDIDAFLIEAELLLDWYIPHRDGFVDRSGALGIHCALARGAEPRLRLSPRPGYCATTTRPTCCGFPSARASRASACSISRMR